MNKENKNRAILSLVTLIIGWGNLILHADLVTIKHPIFLMFVYSCIGVGSYQFGVLIGKRYNGKS